jgi:hypothetical protein
VVDHGFAEVDADAALRRREAAHAEQEPARNFAHFIA